MKTLVSYAQMGFIGLCIGGFVGLIVLKLPLWGLGASLLAGVALIGGLLTFLGERYKQHRRPIHLGMTGVLPGLLLGGYIGDWLGNRYVGALIGLLYGLFVFSVLAFRGVNVLERKNWYVPYLVETVVFFLMGLVGSWAGFYITPFFLNKESVLFKLTLFFVPFITSIFSALLPGVIFSRNYTRPLFSSLLGILSGTLVLWVGIVVTPFLFLPGSGLMWAGLIIGPLMITVSALALFFPQYSPVFGGLLIFLSVLSFVGAVGGLIVGGLVGILAGGLLASWRKPQEVSRSENESAGQSIGDGEPLAEGMAEEVAVAKFGDEVVQTNGIQDIPRGGEEPT